MGTIYKRGGTYYIDYFANGKRIREAVGPKKKEAEAELGAALLEIREGRFHHRVAKRIKIADAVDRYLKLCAHGQSGDDKKRYLAAFCESFKDRLLSTIGNEEIAGWLAERAAVPIVYVKKVGEEVTRTEKPRSVATCNREFATIRHFFNTMIAWNKLILSPCAGIKAKKEPKGRTQYLTVEEATRLIEKASAHLKPIILLSLETGMRKAEVLGVKWEHLDYSGRSIYIPKTKNGESRNVPMSERLAAMLKKHPVRVGSAYVFAKKKNGKPYLDVRTAFETACGKAGIVGFRFHDLRHTCASWMAMAGVSLMTIGAILGHKTAAMTQRYAHLSKQHLREAVNVLPDSTRPKIATSGNP